MDVESQELGRKAKHSYAGAVTRQSLACSTGTVNVADIPRQESRRENLPQQEADNAKHLAASEGARDQMQIGMRIGHDAGNRGQLVPATTAARLRRQFARRSSAVGSAVQSGTAFVHNTTCVAFKRRPLFAWPRLFDRAPRKVRVQLASASVRPASASPVVRTG